MSKFQIDFDGFVEVVTDHNGGADMEKFSANVKKIIQNALVQHYQNVPQASKVEVGVTITNQFVMIGDFK